MNPQRWNQIESLFRQAVELPPVDVVPFLDRVCGTDLELRRELESLLDCDDPTTPLIEHALPYENVGPYRLLRLLGRGGMGAVYLAVRDDDHFHKEVAVKLLKRGMDTQDMLTRFRQERQILANLEHPFIARLHDGGATADGLPYIVMEYVDGLPITQFCTSHDLSLADRMRLFRMVCEAVQYAHQNLVVHRDLKPGNILITKEGIPKLLDFGVAKLLRPDSDTRTVTGRAQRLLTPRYASPEQVRGQAVSTASDIYALGAVLYELLTGRTPHHFATESPVEIERMICEVEPEKPSRSVTLNEDIPLKKRKQLRRELTGDVDNIVRTAMQKEPLRRYASAAKFAEDIRRHLEGLPVLAQDDRWTYRARKFLRRHKLGAIAASVLAVTLLGGLAASTFEGRRAERRFQLVKQLANAVIFDLDDEMQRLPGATALRASMMQKAASYLDNLAADSGGDPALDLEIAKAYRRVATVEGHPLRSNLGKTAAALAHYQKALDIQERLATHPQTRSEAVQGLIACHIEVGDIQALLGNPQAARAQFQKAAAIAAEVSAGKWAQLTLESQIGVFFRMGDEERNAGAGASAAPHYAKALTIAKEWAGGDSSAAPRRTLRAAHVRVANTLFESGDLFGARDNYQIARSLSAELVRLPVSTSEDRWGEIQVLNNLGDVLGSPEEFNLGDPEGASIRYQAALERAEAMANSDPQDVRARRVLATSYRRLGRMRLDADPRGALEYNHRDLAISEDLRNSDKANIEYRRDTVLARLAVARSLHKLGRTEEALRVLEPAAEIQQAIETVAPQRVWWIRPMGWIEAEYGNLLADRGDAEGALRRLHKAREVAERLLQRAPSSVYMERDLAEAYEAVGRGYATVAKRPETAVAQRADWSTQSCSWLEKSHAIWQEFNRRGVGLPYVAKREKQMLDTLAACRASAR